MPQTSLPGHVPYVLRAGEGPRHLVAGQVIRTLAGTDETAGGFGAVVCEAPLDRGPIPMHWHEREHDTWFVTDGQLAVWCRDGARVLEAGDFAYVRPGDTHSYQSTAPFTRFFGVVAPGGWERFFADAGEPWDGEGLPAADRPFDFSRMGPAMGKHRIMRVADPVYAEATPMTDGDRALPPGHASYYLRTGAGGGDGSVVPLITAAQSNGLFEMHVVGAAPGDTLPPPRRDDRHLFLYVVEGEVLVTLDGGDHVLAAGDSANIPAATPCRVAPLTRSRWVATTS